MACFFRRRIAEKLGKTLQQHEDTFIPALSAVPVFKKQQSAADFKLSISALRNSQILPSSGDIQLQTEDLAAQLKQDSVVEDISAGCGVINFKVNRRLLVQKMLETFGKEQDEKFGLNSELLSRLKRGTTLVEYSSPNIAKKFHAGHLRSTIIGNFIANLKQSLGNNVIRMNYLGDWGMQFGLLGAGFGQFGCQEKLKQNPLQHLFEVYVQVNKEAEHNEDMKQAARDFFRQLEQHESEAVSLWQQFREITVDEYQHIYKRLGVHFDIYSGESFHQDQAQEVVRQLQSRGMMKTSEFLLAQLKNFCGEFLMKKLSLSNCVAVHSLAHMYTLDQLAKGAAKTIRRNFHRVIHNDEFYTLPFHLVRDWLSDSEITVDSEQELFEAIVKWVNQNTEEREENFKDLFKLLRLPQIAPTYLTRVVRKEPLVANNAVCQQLVSDALEVHAVRFESFKSADLESHASFTSTIQPRFGQNMDVIMVVGGVSEGGDYLSECVGYFVAEDRWVNLPHIHNHLDGHAIAVTDSHVYVAGSMEPGFAKTVERYDPNLNTWEQVNSLSTRKHSFGLICVKDILYSIGGHGNFSPGFKDVTVYNPEQDEWQNLDPAPKILRDVKTVSVEDRYVYVMARTPVDMDNDDGLSTLTASYDTESLKWQDVDSLPLVDNYCNFQMAVASTNFYHTASCCSKSYKVTVEAAQQKISRNISDDILESLPPEVLSMEGTAICYLGDDIFIIGGWRNSNNMDKQYRREAYRYCAERKRWMLLPPLPQPRCRAAACHVRIPYQYLYGCQHYPMPQNLARQRDRMQQMQQLHRRTLTLRRQLQSQIEC